MWVAILKNTSNSFEAFKKYNTLVESESKGGKLKCLRSDHGREFTYEKSLISCKENGIEMQLTTLYTPQKNGAVERKNRIILGLVRSLIK